jgi:hypothetical protein
MKRLRKIILLGVLSALVAAGCGSSGPDGRDVVGVVIGKDYDPTTYKTVRTCVRKYTSGSNKGRCADYRTDKKVKEYEDWDVTVRDASGEEYEIDVSEEMFNRVEVGDPWPVP